MYNVTFLVLNCAIHGAINIWRMSLQAWNTEYTKYPQRVYVCRPPCLYLPNREAKVSYKIYNATRPRLDDLATIYSFVGTDESSSNV